MAPFAEGWPCGIKWECLHRLLCLNTWFLAGGAVWGGMALLEEVHHWGRLWGFKASCHSQCTLSALCLWFKTRTFNFLFLLQCFPTTTDCYPWNHSPVKAFFSKLFWSCFIIALSQQQKVTNTAPIYVLAHVSALRANCLTLQGSLQWLHQPSFTQAVSSLLKPLTGRLLTAYSQPHVFSFLSWTCSWEESLKTTSLAPRTHWPTYCHKNVTGL